MAKIQGSKIQRETERVTGGFDHRFDRLIAMIRLLSLRWHTNPQLAKIFQVRIRTIDRDIVLLDRCGFKLLRHGRGWGYSLEAGYKIPLREPAPDSQGSRSPEVTVIVAAQISVLAQFGLLGSQGDAVEGLLFGGHADVAKNSHSGSLLNWIWV